MGLTFTPADVSYPTVYSEDAWDIAGSESALATLMDGTGTWSQSDINEKLAEGVNNAASNPSLPTNLLKMQGRLPIAKVIDQETGEERDQTLEEALAAVQNPSVGDVYLYVNASNDNLTEEYVYVEHEEEVEVGGETTTQTVGEWQLLGIKQDVMHVTAENIKDADNQPTNKWKLKFS